MQKRDTQKKEAFAAKMSSILNHGALNLAMGIGYRLDLFEALDELAQPADVHEIAARSGLSVRYVREWLGVMVCGGVVEISADRDGQELFFLPGEHADLITRRAGSANMGVYTQEVPLLTRLAFDEVQAGFRTGQGVGYERYGSFYDFMGQLAAAKHRDVLLDSFLPGVDGGEMVKRLEKGIRVFDMGCAQGTALLLLAEAFPRSEFTGIDISRREIEAARIRAEERRLGNVSFEVLDAAELGSAGEWAESFDYVTAFDAVHDQSRPLEALKGVVTILKKGGWFSMVDIAASSRMAENRDHPMGAFLYAVSLMHCLPVGLVGGGAGLGMMWGRDRAVDMLKQAGFARVEVQEMAEDPFNFHFFCQKSAQAPARG
jgi:SAM-dependent methyltransferase